MSPHLSVLSRDSRILSWSRRILIVSLLGIAALTLFPFRFDFSRGLPGNTSPFFLGSFNKGTSILDVFLNVLLFVPFGFGIASQLRFRNRSWALTFVLAFAGGAICSYCIEFLQIYVPGRDSGWEDVITNSTGAIVGCWVFWNWGEALSRILSNFERTIEAWLTPLRAAVLLVGYLGVCFAVSIPLQLKTRLSNWDPNAFFLIGGDSSGHGLWRGKIFNLQIWDRSLADIEARALTTDTSPAPSDPHLLVSADFSRASEFRDEKSLLPILLSMPNGSPLTKLPTLDLRGDSWLISREPVSGLVHTLEKTNQFALRIVCEPAEPPSPDDGYIISIGDESHVLDLRLRQEGSSLIIWIRSPLSMGRGNLVWSVPHAFVPNRTRKILVTYDGSYGFVYVDGERAFPPYRLSPGAGLAQMLLGIGTPDLNGYIVAYDSLVFVPLGLVLGIETRRISEQRIVRWLLFGFAVVFPTILFELFLDHLSERTTSLGGIALCASLVLIGCLLINADRRPSHEDHVIADTPSG
jgi:glycopeptide antibiotics resistance protein